MTMPDPEGRVRWGVLGAAKIAVGKVIPGMRLCEHAVVTAIASRSSEKARHAADSLGIPKAYGSYEELLADPEIDVVYNPLPNHLHVPWSIRSLEAGKHVLCEKPIGLSSEDGRRLVAAGREHPSLKLMEAFMYRFHPQWIHAKNAVDEGRLGSLRTIQTFFSYFNRDPANVRHDPTMGGGGLLDIGCYPISLSRFLFGAEPRRVVGWIENDPDFEVDRLASAILEFEKGTSTFTCGMQIAPFQRVQAFDDRGLLEIEIPFNAPPDRPCRMRIRTDDREENVSFPVADQYAIQADLLSEAVLEDGPVPTPIEDAVANMLVIEAIFRSVRTGRWESPTETTGETTS